MTADRAPEGLDPGRMTEPWSPCPLHASQNLTDGPCRECAINGPFPDNPCYRSRNLRAHRQHLWRNGIQIGYNVRCPGYPPDPSAQGAGEVERRG